MVQTCGFSTKALCLLCTGLILGGSFSGLSFLFSSLFCLNKLQNALLCPDCQPPLHSQEDAVTFNSISVVSGFGLSCGLICGTLRWGTFSLRLLDCLAHTSVAMKLHKCIIQHMSSFLNYREPYVSPWWNGGMSSKSSAVISVYDSWSFLLYDHRKWIQIPAIIIL